MAPARSFEATVLPLLDSAYNLARWLLRDNTRAEDAVQEAVLRAMRYFDKLRGDEARAWFLAIVRNVCFTQLQNRTDAQELLGYADDALEAFQWSAGLAADEPAVAMQQSREHTAINAALRDLPAPLREVVVLREFEDLSYEEIARITSLPLGTVMSRLSRARARMKIFLTTAGVRE